MTNKLKIETEVIEGRYLKPIVKYFIAENLCGLPANIENDASVIIASINSTITGVCRVVDIPAEDGNPFEHYAINNKLFQNDSTCAAEFGRLCFAKGISKETSDLTWQQLLATTKYVLKQKKKSKVFSFTSPSVLRLMARQLRAPYKVVSPPVPYYGKNRQLVEFKL